MLSWLVATSLRLRVLVVALAALALGLGAWLVPGLPLDVFPEFAPPLVEIQTEAPGLSTEEVESLVSIPLESALSGTPWLTTLRSKSVLGLSSVVLIFRDGTDLLQARQLVQERLAGEASRLPALAKAPVMLPALSSTSRAMKIGLTSPRLSQMELTTLAKWTIRPRLMAVPGVAGVAIWGERNRQLQVQVDPERLAASGIALGAVLRAAADAAAPAAGGFLDSPNQRMAVRQLSLEDDPEALARAPLAVPGGAPIRLGDLTQVVAAPPPAIGDAVVNGKPGLLLIVEKQAGSNTLAITRGVEAALAALAPGLPDVAVDSHIFRPATFIEAAIANLRTALLVGSLLVALVLFAFFQEPRAALISLVALPLSLTLAGLALAASGAALDTMVLAGLVIAVGVVVDDAIIDIENIVRRLRLEREAPEPRPALAVVLGASLEVRSAVVIASLVVALVFVPVYFLPGVAGAFFRPLAAAYVLAILASMLVALTVTPALALLLLPGGRHTEDTPVARRLKHAYRRLLPRFLERPRLAAASLGVSIAVAVALLPILGEEFLPSFRERDFLMHWVEKPGTSLDAMRRITLRVSHELLAIPGVRHFGSHIGRAESADEVVGPNFSELWISIDPEIDYDATVAQINEAVAGYPGLVRDVLTYLRERIKEVLTGASASIVVRIYGPELDGLRRHAREVAAAIEGTAGVVQLKVESQVLVPQVEIRFRPERGEALGVTQASVRDAVASLVHGAKVGEVRRDQMSFDVFVWGSESARSDLAALRRLPIDGPGGGSIPLSSVADVAIVDAPNEIKREAASRRIDVTCNVEGRDLGAVAREIETRLRELAFAPGYHPELLGEYQAREAARARLLALSGLVVLGIFLLLHADLGSLRLAGLVFGTLPFALVGGVLAAAATGGVISLGSLVGFVSVLGIAARNGILLVSHYRHLETVEGIPFGPELVLRGAEERLVPILMTASCAALALLPLALAGNAPGHEIEHPMAIVILGGLVTSTALNLLVLPALYARFGSRPEPILWSDRRSLATDTDGKTP
jgi:CzcA family heavy metal efflux pump